MPRSLLKYSIWVIISILVVINIFVFVNSMRLSNDVSFYETEIRKTHLNNIELEKKASGIDSLQYASSMAAIMNFTKKEIPLYLDNLKYALNR